MASLSHWQDNHRSKPQIPKRIWRKTNPKQKKLKLWSSIKSLNDTFSTRQCARPRLLDFGYTLIFISMRYAFLSMVPFSYRVSFFRRGAAWVSITYNMEENECALHRSGRVKAKMLLIFCDCSSGTIRMGYLYGWGHWHPFVGYASRTNTHYSSSDQTHPRTHCLSQ